MTLSKTLKIRERHGFDPLDETLITKEGYSIPGSNFYAEVGLKTNYTVREIRRWLGY